MSIIVGSGSAVVDLDFVLANGLESLERARCSIVNMERHGHTIAKKQEKSRENI